MAIGDTTWLGVAAVLATTGVAGCDDGTITIWPSPTLVDVQLHSRVSEVWGRQSIMIVGDTGSVHVDCVWSDQIGHVCDPSPRFSTSEPEVLGVLPGHFASTVSLEARSRGLATVRVEVGRFVRDLTIEVMATPLPLDDLAIELTRPEHWCADCAAQYDSASGRLVDVTMPVGTALPFSFRAWRQTKSVALRDWTLGTTNPNVAAPSKSCRPRSMDPNCDVVGANWVAALAPGDAAVSLTVRNLTARFSVNVTGTQSH